ILFFKWITHQLGNTNERCDRTRCARTHSASQRQLLLQHNVYTLVTVDGFQELKDGNAGSVLIRVQLKSPSITFTPQAMDCLLVTEGQGNFVAAAFDGKSKNVESTRDVGYGCWGKCAKSSHFNVHNGQS